MKKTAASAIKKVYMRVEVELSANHIVCDVMIKATNMIVVVHENI